MGRLTGIGGSTIRDLEKGKAKRPHLETQQRIADFFGIDKGTIWRG